MLHPRASGGALLEFALLVPPFIICAIAFACLGLIAAFQFRLDRLCADTARVLALSELTSTQELIFLAEEKLEQETWPVTIRIRRHEVPTKILQWPQVSKPLDMIELTLEQTVRIPFFPAPAPGREWLKLRSTAWEGRVQL